MKYLKVTLVMNAGVYRHQVCEHPYARHFNTEYGMFSLLFNELWLIFFEFQMLVVSLSLLYAACFVTMVMQSDIGWPWGWPSLLHNHSNEASHIILWQTILICNRYYLMNNLIPLPAKLEHCYLFTCLTPAVDRSNHFFFLSCHHKRNLLVWILNMLKQLWNWPLYKIFCDPLAFWTWNDTAAILNTDPWSHTNIIKLLNLVCLFSCWNQASSRPIPLPHEARSRFVNNIYIFYYYHYTVYSHRQSDFSLYGAGVKKKVLSFIVFNDKIIFRNPI